MWWVVVGVVVGNHFAKSAVETALLDAMGKRVGLVVSGGNIDSRLLASVLLPKEWTTSTDVSVFLPLEQARLSDAAEGRARTSLFARYSWELPVSVDQHAQWHFPARAGEPHQTIPIATDDQNIQLKWNAFHARSREGARKNTAPMTATLTPAPHHPHRRDLAVVGRVDRVRVRHPAGDEPRAEPSRDGHERDCGRPGVDERPLSLEDDRIHALILGYWHTIITPPMVFAKLCAEVVQEARDKGIDKPVVASLVGDVQVEEASEYLYERGIVAYPYTTELPVAVLGAKYKWARGAGVL